MSEYISRKLVEFLLRNDLIAANASHGLFGISPSDDVPVKQKWQYCYNALSPVSSTMKNVSLVIDWQYDLANTNYELYN